MEKVKKPIYKKWWFWVIAIVIVLGAIGSVNDSNEGNAKEKQDVKSTDNTPKKAKPKSDGLSDKIKEAADPHFGKVKSIEINDDMGKNDGGKIVLVHVKQDGLTKRTVDYNTTNALKEVFKIDKVNEITYFWEATLVDSKGNESVDTVVKIQMSKDTAKTIDWNNFLYTNLDKVSDSYNASPVVK